MEKWVEALKPYGIGLVVLLVSFVMGMYAAFVYHNYYANPPSVFDTARFNELKTSALVGLISYIIGIIGVLIFLVEFMKHEHAVPSAKVSTTPPQNADELPRNG